MVRITSRLLAIALAGAGFAADAAEVSLENGASFREGLERAGKSGTLLLGDGEWVIGETVELSGCDGLTIAAKPGAKPRLTGARKVDPADLHPVADPETLKLLGEEARGKVVRFDLAKYGGDAFEFPADEFRMPFPMPELYQGGRRLTMARWPNRGWSLVRDVSDPGTGIWDKKKKLPPRGATFRPVSKDVCGWDVSRGIWAQGFWRIDWYDGTIEIESINPKDGTVKLKYPSHYAVGPKPYTLGRRWRALNFLQGLDEPGEYVIDRKERAAYVWLRDGGGELAVGCPAAPLLKFSGCGRVEVRGIEFAAGGGDALEFTNCTAIVVRDCLIHDFGGQAVIVGGGRDNRVESCMVTDTRRGGVTLIGGDRRTLEPAGHAVADCEFRRFAEHKLTYSSAIHLEGVGLRAEHNLVADAPHQGVYFKGNDMVFANNIVSNVCVEADDAGALYMGRNPSCSGNKILNNLFVDIGKPRGHGNCAIYFDDFEGGGDLVKGNVFIRCGQPCTRRFGAIHVNLGNGVTAENNIFAHCVRALGASRSGLEKWQRHIKGQFHGRLHREVDVSAPVYQQKYPHMKDYLDVDAVKEERWNWSRRNAFVNCGSVAYTRGYGTSWKTNETDRVIAGPWTVESVAKAVPGFEPIELAKMGPRRRAPFAAPAAAFAEPPMPEFTVRLNERIEQVGAMGGGRVTVPAGKHVSGTIFLKSGVELHLEKGAEILGSECQDHYPVLAPFAARSTKDKFGWTALIVAEGCRNVKITGEGTIDGRGGNFATFVPGMGGDMNLRPRGILMVSCKDIEVSGVRLRDPAMWMQHYFDCENLTVRGVDVWAHANRNNDGIDVDGCRNVLVENCTIHSGDDAIVVKSTGKIPCRGLVFRNCVVSSHCNPIKLGTESLGGYSDVLVENCKVAPSPDPAEKPISGFKGGIAALNVELVDGGTCENVTYRNIEVEGYECPIYVRLADRGRRMSPEDPRPAPGVMRNIAISNVTVKAAGNYCSSITGIEGAYPENVILENISIENVGGLKPGEWKTADQVSENPRGYPQPTVWGNLPTRGLFVRHVRGLTLKNVKFTSVNPDPRPDTMFIDYANPFNPLDLPKTVRRIKATYGSPAGAMYAKASVAPLRDNKEFAMTTRWDDSAGRHAQKAPSVANAGFKGNFYLNHAGADYVNAVYPQIKASGGVVGNHTLRHPFIPELAVNEMVREIVRHKVTLECAASQTVASFTFPYNAPRATYDLGYSAIVGKILQASGHYVYASSARDIETIGLDARQMQGGAFYFSANDRNPDADAFAAQMKTAVGVMRGERGKAHPLVVFGTHSWCDDEGDAKQRAFLATEAGKPERWYPNDLEYAAYRYGATFANLRKVKSEGRTAWFEYDEYPAAAFGKKADLSFVFEGEQPLAAEADGVKLAKSERGCWNLPETGMSEVRIVRREFGKIGFRAKLDAEKQRIEYVLANRGGERLDGVWLTALLPPKCGTMRRVVEIGSVQPGETLTGVIDYDCTGAAAHLLDGSAYCAVSADMTTPSGAVRIWDECEEPAAASAKTLPRDCAVVFGPVAADALTPELVRTLTKPGAAVKPALAAAGLPMPANTPDVRWAGFRVAYLCHGVKDAGKPGAPRLRTYAVADVKAPKAGEYVLRLASTRATPSRYWINGAEGKFDPVKDKIDYDAKVRLEEGPNRILAEYDYSGNNYCSMSMGVYEKQPLEMLEFVPVE